MPTAPQKIEDHSGIFFFGRFSFMKIYAEETKKDIFKINTFPDRITTGKGFKGTVVNQG